MAISNAAFASELITDQNEVLKFDDIGCMLDYKKNMESKNIAAIFVKDYESREWIPLEKSTIVETGIKTPMGSGKIAFKDSAKAAEYQKKYPKQMSELHLFKSLKPEHSENGSNGSSNIRRRYCMITSCPADVGTIPNSSRAFRSIGFARCAVWEKII